MLLISTFISFSKAGWIITLLSAQRDNFEVSLGILWHRGQVSTSIVHLMKFRRSKEGNSEILPLARTIKSKLKVKYSRKISSLAFNLNPIAKLYLCPIVQRKKIKGQTDWSSEDVSHERSENPGRGLVVLWWALSAPLVEIGLTESWKHGKDQSLCPHTFRRPWL